MLMKSPEDGMSKDILKGRKEDLLTVGSLDIIWPDCQQSFVQKRAAAIAENFNWELLGVVIVCGPIRGKYHIADGQHRVAAVLKRFGPKETIPCIIYPGEKTHAAWLFHELNLRRWKPKTIDLFKTAVIAGQEPEATINRLVRSVGYTMGAAGPRGIDSVRAVDVVYRLGGAKLLTETLLAIRETWGTDEPKATDSIIISSFGSFLANYREAERVRLYEAISKQFTATRLIGKIRTNADSNDISNTQAGKDVLARIYDAGLRSDRRLLKTKK